MDYSYGDGDLVSAIQKTIRRGLAEDAVKIGIALFRRSPQRIITRLMVITVEDVDWRLTPDVALLSQRARELLKQNQQESAEQLIIQAIKLLANHPKTKLVCWCGDLSKERYRAFIPQWRSLLEDAFSVNSVIDVVGLSLVGFRAEGYKPIFDLFGTWAVLRGPFAMRVIAGLRWRVTQSARPCDQEILIQAGAVALCSTEPIVHQVPDVTGLKLPWFFADLHTDCGRVSARILAKKNGMSPTRLEYLQFFSESILIEPMAEEEAKYRDQALNILFKKFVGVSMAEGLREWETIRPSFERVVDWVLRRQVPALQRANDNQEFETT